MNEKSQAPGALPEIAEADATGTTRRIFEDFKQVLGVPAVNTLLRHFATIPGCLEWVWAEWRPLYLEGSLTRATTRLLAETPVPQTRPLEPGEYSAVGLDDEARAGIAAVLDFYLRANPVNLIALLYLLDRIDGPGAAPSLPEEGAPTGQPAGPRAGPPLPPLRRLEDMALATADAVRRLTALGAGEQSTMIPGLYRHLANWPGLLPALAAALATISRSGDIERAAATMEENARACARRLGPETQPAPAALSCCPPPRGRARDRFLDFARPFPRTIARMTVTARVIDALLGGGTNGRETQN